MSKRVVRESQEVKILHKWWMRTALSLAFLGLAYGFISLAIDSGNWLEYAIGLCLVWYGVKFLIRVFKPIN